MKTIAIAVLCGALILIGSCGVTPLTPGNSEFNDPLYDHHQYIAMAEGQPAIAPFAYRVLVPWLAAHLPGDIQTDFQFITMGSMWLAGLLLYALLRAWAIRPVLAILGVVFLYSSRFFVPYYTWDFWLCDPLVIVCLIGALWAAKSGRLLWFAVFLLVGALTKEAIVAAVPLWFTLQPRRMWGRGLAAIVPALLILVGLRLAIAVPGSSILDTIRGELAVRLHTPNLWFIVTVGLFGPLFALPWLTRAGRDGLLRLAPMIGVIYFQLLIASDTERLLMLALPAFIVASLLSTQAILNYRHNVAYLPQWRSPDDIPSGSYSDSHARPA